MIEFHQRLREARLAAGFATARDAVDRFGWTYATYTAHENGHRGAKAAAVSDYARAFRTTEQWLTYGTGKRDAKRPDPDHYQFAFREAAIVPFERHSSNSKTDIQTHLKEIFPAVRHASIYEVRQPFPSLAMLAGDILLVDLNSKPRDGQAVVVTKADRNTGEATTSILRLAGDLMVGDIGQRPINVGDSSIAILGSVCGVLRLT